MKFSTRNCSFCKGRQICANLIFSALFPFTQAILEVASSIWLKMLIFLTGIYYNKTCHLKNINTHVCKYKINYFYPL